MSLRDKIKGLLRRHGSELALCGKIAAKTLLPIGGARIADCLYALFEFAKDKGDDLTEEALLARVEQLGAEQEYLIKIVGELDGRLGETLEQMTQMAGFGLPEEGLQKLLETQLSTQHELAGLRAEWAQLSDALQQLRAEQRAQHQEAREERALYHDEARRERQAIYGELAQLRAQLKVSARGALSDSLSIRGAEERKLIKALLGRYRSLPAAERADFSLQNDLSVLLMTAGEYDEAERLLAAVTAREAQERALASFNRYLNQLRAGDLKAALEHYLGAVRADQKSALFPPEKYTPKKILGFGAFGVTFLCDQFGAEVALKSITLEAFEGSEEARLKQLTREWLALRTLQDPRVIRALDFEPNRQPNGEARPYLVMEYFSGLDLDRARRQAPEQFAAGAGLRHSLTVAREIALGLRAAHQQGIIHRDIKPQNLLYQREGAGLSLRLIDFGLALPPRRLRAESVYLSTEHAPPSLLMEEIAGTLNYAPPEQLGEGGAVGPHSDIFSWGKTLSFLLFGRPNPRLRELKSLPEGLQLLLDESLDPEPTERLQSFDEVLPLLEAELRTLGVPIVGEGGGSSAAEFTAMPTELKRTEPRSEQLIPGQLIPGQLIPGQLIPGQQVASEVSGVQLLERVVPAVEGRGEPFLLMETPVTQALYQAVIGLNPSNFKGPQRPLESVSWEDGVKFANALSEKLGLQPAYEGVDNHARLVEGADGFRLPFEAEWEWAARGGESYRYSGSDELNEVAWFLANSSGVTRHVAQLKANGYGCSDMSGNIWEWCADDWERSGQHHPGAAMRVIRGGSWCVGADDCEISCRRRRAPDHSNRDLGLRLLRPLSS